MGVRFPLPAPSILFIFSGLRGAALTFSDTGYKIRYSAHPVYFQQVEDLWHLLFTSNLYIVSVVYAKLRYAQRIIGPR